MGQMFTALFTPAATPVPFKLDPGFRPARVEIENIGSANSAANPGVVKFASWQDTDAAASALLIKNTDGANTDARSVIASAGISVGNDTAIYGSFISAFSNAVVNTAAIVVADVVGPGFAVGDTIGVTQVADSGLTSALSLNGTYTIFSVTAATNTIVVNQATNQSGRGVYVSGGEVVRLKDANGNALASSNLGKYFILVGTGVQCPSVEMRLVAFSKDNVV